MSAQKQEQINLLPQKGFEASTTGRVLTWILSSFRVIVIVTEIIVMGAFLSRFWLDAQNSDLDDELQQKQALLTASLSFEKEFKNTQKRLKIFSDLTANEGVVTDSLQTVTKFLPQDLFLTSVRFFENSLEIQGTSPSEISIQQLIVNLLSTDKFGDISLNEIKTNAIDPNILDFTIDLSLEHGKE